MPIEVTACQTLDDMLPALTPVFHYFGVTPVAQDGTRFVPFIEPSRAFMARENGTVVGGCGSFPFEMTVPGGVPVTVSISSPPAWPMPKRRWDQPRRGASFS